MKDLSLQDAPVNEGGMLGNGVRLVVEGDTSRGALEVQQMSVLLSIEIDLHRCGIPRGSAQAVLVGIGDGDDGVVEAKVGGEALVFLIF